MPRFCNCTLIFERMIITYANYLWKELAGSFPSPRRRVYPKRTALYYESQDMQAKVEVQMAAVLEKDIFTSIRA